MRRISIKSLQPGMILGKTLYGENGEVLLRKGVKVTSAYMEALARRGFTSLYVNDGLGDDIEPEDIISEVVRETTQKNVRKVFDTVVKATMEMRAPHQVRQLGPAHYDHGAFEALYKDIESIIDEVMEKETLSGITSLKSYDNYTFCHSIDVTVIALMLGKRLYLDRSDLRGLALGCLLHDIGKTKVALTILNKPGPLTYEERQQVEMHPFWSYEMIKTMPTDSHIPRNVALSHHERQDGEGYPRKLKGLNRIRRTFQELHGTPRIMLSAEIAAVADVYSAMSSDRPYRPALSPENIVSTLKEMAGFHLNSELVRRFLFMVPTFPEGIGVVVSDGLYKGFKGVVSRININRMDRPVVRLCFDASGKPIDPFEVDTGKIPNITISSVMDLPVSDSNLLAGLSFT